MHKIILFLTAATSILLTPYGWIGANNGLWTTASNWSTFVVPNSITAIANISNTSGGNANISLTSNVTVNQVNFTSTGTMWGITGTGNLTLDGPNAKIQGSSQFQGNGGFGGQFYSNLILNSDITNDNPFNGGITYNYITATGRTINQTGLGVVYFQEGTGGGTRGTRPGPVIAGTYNFKGQGVYIYGDALGGSGGMSLNYFNTVASSEIDAWYSGLSSPIVFNDTASNDFYLRSSPAAQYTFSGSLSGNIQHKLTLESSIFTGNLSALSSSGAGHISIANASAAYSTIFQGTAATSLPSSIPISIGDGIISLSTSNGDLFYFNSTGTIGNPISIEPSLSGSAGIFSLQAGAGANFSGGLVLNSNQSTIAGNTFAWTGLNAGTISGVVSNAASNAANIKFTVAGTGSLTLSGNNTYTSPTNVTGILNVTGDSGSSAVTLSGTLMGSGKVGSVTASTGTIDAYSLVAPSSSQILTVNGNLNETGSVAHNFQVSSGNASSKLQVNGNVTLHGTVSTNAATLGTYTLLSYTGTRTGTLSTSIGGGTITYDDAGKNVILTIAPVTSYTWIGTNGANYSVAANWNPATVPNGTNLTAIQNTAGGPTVDTNIVINKYLITASGGGTVNWGSGSVTFDGTNPTVDTTGAASGSITWAPNIKLNQDLLINTGNATFWSNGAITSNSHNIIQNSTGGGGVRAAYSGMVGGNYYLNSGSLFVTSDGLGGSSGPTIVMGNSGSVSSTLNSNGTSYLVGNKISFNDTGTLPFILNPSNSTLSGNVTGSLTHPLIISSATTLSGSWSGFSTSSTITIAGGGTTIPASFPTAQLILGDPSLGAGNLFASNVTNFSNKINVSGGSSNYLSYVGTSSSNIVLNYDQNASTGKTFTIGGAATFTGVISSAASGSPMTFVIGSSGAQKIILNGVNTYAYPTSVVGTLEVNGSAASSSLVSVTSGATLQGSGIVGPVSAVAGAAINAGSTSATTSQVLTINGNLNETGAVVHNFQVGAGNLASKLQVNGNITLNGSVTTNAATNGTYTLMSYTGTRSGTLTTAIAGGVISYDDTNKLVILTITAVTNFSWSGANNAVYSLNTNWSPAQVPNSSAATANISNTVGTSSTLTVDMYASLNQLNFNSTGTTWTLAGNSGVGSLSFNGPGATINATQAGVINVPITLAANSNLAITGTGSITTPARSTKSITAGSNNITNTNTGMVNLSVAGTGTGTFNHSGGILGLSGNTFPSMPIVWSNLVSGTAIMNNNGNSATMTSPVQLNDVGSYDFNLGDSVGDPYQDSAVITGTITHNLVVRYALFQNNILSSLVFSGGSKFIVSDPGESYDGLLLYNMPSSLPSGLTINLGNSLASGITAATNGGFIKVQSGTSMSNQILVRPGTGAIAGTYLINIPTGFNFGGNIVLNSDSNSSAGAIFQYGHSSNSSSSTLSGVVSNGASGASNITFNVITSGNGSITMSGNNTYTSPTTISNASPGTYSTILDVTGSIGNSSLVTVAAGGTLQGSGTVGPVTAVSGTSIIAGSLVSPTTSQVLTINGALNETSVTHKFQIGTGNLSSKFQVNGNVNLSGTVTVNSSVSGTYTIMSFTGTRTGTLTTAITGATITYDNTVGAGRVILTIP
jgi:fibronectin-binding autotransporter adhesin